MQVVLVNGELQGYGYNALQIRQQVARQIDSSCLPELSTGWKSYLIALSTRLVRA